MDLQRMIVSNKGELCHLTMTSRGGSFIEAITKWARTTTTERSCSLSVIRV